MSPTTSTQPMGPGVDLPARHAQLHREMIDQLERTAALENHWLMYGVWGVLNLSACVASHCLLEAGMTELPYHWPLAGVWLAQIIAALLSAKFITGEPQIEDSPLQRYVRGLWIVFLLMTCNVAVLTLIAQQPVRLFLPFLATVSSCVLLVAGFLFSRRLSLAALLLFASGSLMGNYPRYGFLIYGVAWLIVMLGLSLVFWRKRQRWRDEVLHSRTATCDTAVAARVRTVGD